jgi:hypothetical protein
MEKSMTTRMRDESIRPRHGHAYSDSRGASRRLATIPDQHEVFEPAKSYPPTTVSELVAVAIEGGPKENLS